MSPRSFLEPAAYTCFSLRQGSVRSDELGVHVLLDCRQWCIRR